MICVRCLRRLRPGAAAARPARLLAAAGTSALPSSRRSASAAAQPFTVPAAMSRPADGPAAEGDKTGRTAIAMSSVSGGTTLRGLNIYKDRQDPVAMEDAEYPEWLWRVLDRPGADGDGSPEALLSKMTKRQAKKAKKNMRKHDKNPGHVEVAIPIEEQSVDLPTSDGSPESMKDFADTAKELTHAMRVKRRAAIKESNFLKSMS